MSSRKKVRKVCKECGAKKYVKFLDVAAITPATGNKRYICINTAMCKAHKRGVNYRK